MTSTDTAPDVTTNPCGAELPFDYLRVSVTNRCQLSCAYCRPRHDPPLEPRTPLALPRLVECCAAICAVAPIRKIRLSGGEPLLRPDLPELVAQLAALPTHPEVTLTTNGLLLAEQAEALAAAGLSRVNVSLDTADAGCYARLTGQDGLAAVLRGLDAARAAGFRDLKINVVLRQSLGNDEIKRLLALAADHGALLRLIELMPLGLEPDYYAAMYLPAAEALERLAAAAAASPEALPATSVHPRYRVGLADGRNVTVELISPMSRPFCGECRRLRLSCDGQVIPCLLSPTRLPLLDAAGNLPDAAALRALLREALTLKRRADGGLPDGMWRIGG